MSDEYECAAKSKLKLKNDYGIKKKKKKSKDKDKQKQKEALQRNAEADKADKCQRNFIIKHESTEQRIFTKAELAFKQQQEKIRNKRILEKATTTHKQRVEKFNEHLDTLTEHFDIPKVSWTK
uniref:Protein FAM32A n=1 Tax=Glossina brevipalpis TaxID=37001 RepID=A0A1A9WA78_9MUSC